MADCAAAAGLSRRPMPFSYGHGGVHDDDVRLMLLCKRDRCAAVGGLRHHVKTFVALQQHAQPFSHDRVVIGKKDSDRSHGIFNRRSP
jgi:hypothetical protein